ncbi:MAG: hypothetical protein HLX51_00430 [Micrococcaceae bacterium]|nr:hypothetical protein [Micrococcaceae bacterium]
MNTIEITRPVARQDHFCEVCGPGIKQGDQYSRTVSVDGGDFSVFKCCLEPCLDVVNKCFRGGFYDRFVGGVTGDDAREWAHEHVGVGGLIDDPDALKLLQRLEQHNAQHTP